MKKHTQSPPSAHSNHQKQTLMGEVYARLEQKTAAAGFSSIFTRNSVQALTFPIEFLPSILLASSSVQHCLATRWMTRNRIRKHHLLIELATVYCDSTPRSSLQSWLRPPPACSRLGSPVTIVLQTVTVKGTGCFSFTCYFANLIYSQMVLKY